MPWSSTGAFVVRAIVAFKPELRPTYLARDNMPPRKISPPKIPLHKKPASPGGATIASRALIRVRSKRVAGGNNSAIIAVVNTDDSAASIRVEEAQPSIDTDSQRIVNLCEHGRQRSYCKTCKVAGNGGGSICEHNRIRSYCKDCKLAGIGGGSICEH